MMFCCKSDGSPDGVEAASGFNHQPAIVVWFEIGRCRASWLADDVIRNRIDTSD